MSGVNRFINAVKTHWWVKNYVKTNKTQEKISNKLAAVSLYCYIFVFLVLEVCLPFK